MFVDDLCVFSPSVKGLQKVVNVCQEYAANNCIIFNNNKTVSMIHHNKKFKVNIEPNIILDGRCIKFVNSVKYLGVLITNDLFDDLDINRLLGYLYCIGNTLRSKFHNCSSQVKDVFFVYTVCLCILFIYGVNSKSAVQIMFILHTTTRSEFYTT